MLATTLAQELARLTRAVKGGSHYPGLAITLAAIARDPHRILTKNEVWVRRERVRRLEPAGLVAAFRRADNTDLKQRLPIQLPDVRVEHTVDVYENRLLRSYHDQVATRLRRLQAAFLTQNSITAVLETEQLQETLARARRTAGFLDNVSALRQIPTTVTMVLLKRPEYRSLLEGYLNFRRSAYVELDEPALESPLENLPKLYEIWGTLQAIQVLLDLSTELGFTIRNQRLAHHFDGGVYIRILNDGAPAVELEHPTTHTLVQLTPQRRFTPGTTPLRSISFNQIPDITIEITNGQQRHLLLLDPKYKLQSEEQNETGDGKPKKIDIDTMHAYRDAIRDHNEHRVVNYAAILYPGPETRYGDGIEALSARPLSPSNLQQRLRTVLTHALAQPDEASLFPSAR